MKKLDYSIIDWIAGVPKYNLEDFEFICDTFGLKYRINKIYNHKVVTFNIHEMRTEQLHVIFEFVKNNLFRITRIDVKFDFEISIENLLNSDSYTNYSNIIMGKEGIETIYYGNRGSNLFCRIYDKGKELKIDDVLTRLEYEIKSDLAEEFNEQVRFFGYDEAISYIYKKIVIFNEKNEIHILDNYETVETLKINILKDKSDRVKFKNFCVHNSNSIINYMKKYNLSFNMFMTLINDVSNFDKNLDKFIFCDRREKIC